MFSSYQSQGALNNTEYDIGVQRCIDENIPNNTDNGTNYALFDCLERLRHGGITHEELRDSNTAGFHSAQVHFDAGNYESAIKDYDLILSRMGDTPSSCVARYSLSDLECSFDLSAASNSKAAALIQLGKYEEANEYIDKALAFYSHSNIEALNNKGVVLDNLGRPSEAILYYNEALKINSERTDILNNKGAALGKMGRYQEAIDLFQQAELIKSKQDEFMAILNGSVSNATLNYSNLFPETDSNMSEKNSMLSAILRNLNGSKSNLSNKTTGIIGQSEKDLNVEQIFVPTAFAKETDNFPQFNGLNYVSLSNDIILVKIDPEKINKGISFYHLVKYDDAMVIFDESLKINSSYAPSLFYKGQIYEKLGDTNHANEYKVKAKASDPNYKGDFITIATISTPFSQALGLK